MGDALSYAWERSHKAVRSLILARGSIQQRLYHGYTQLPGFDVKEIGDDHIAFEMEEIIRECTKGNPASTLEDHVQATIYSMTEDEAAIMADRILSLFIHIAEMNTKRHIKRSR